MACVILSDNCIVILGVFGAMVRDEHRSRWSWQ